MEVIHTCTASRIRKRASERQAETNMQVKLTFEGVLAQRVAQALTRDAVGCLEDVPNVGHVEVILAGDLEQSVKRRLGPEEAVTSARSA